MVFSPHISTRCNIPTYKGNREHLQYISPVRHRRAICCSLGHRPFAKPASLRALFWVLGETKDPYLYGSVDWVPVRSRISPLSQLLVHLLVSLRAPVPRTLQIVEYPFLARPPECVSNYRQKGNHQRDDQIEDVHFIALRSLNIKISVATISSQRVALDQRKAREMRGPALLRCPRHPTLKDPRKAYLSLA